MGVEGWGKDGETYFLSFARLYQIDSSEIPTSEHLVKSHLEGCSCLEWSGMGAGGPAQTIPALQAR